MDTATAANAITAKLAELATGNFRSHADRWTRLEDWCAGKAVVRVTGDNEIVITHPHKGAAIITLAIDLAIDADTDGGWIDPTDVPKIAGRTTFRPRP